MRQLNKQILKLCIAAALLLPGKSYLIFIRSFQSIAKIGMFSKVAEPRVNWYRTWPLLNQSACNLCADWLQAHSDEQVAVEPEAPVQTNISQCQYIWVSQ